MAPFLQLVLGSFFGSTLPSGDDAVHNDININIMQGFLSQFNSQKEMNFFKTNLRNYTVLKSYLKFYQRDRQKEKELSSKYIREASTGDMDKKYLPGQVFEAVHCSHERSRCKSTQTEQNHKRSPKAQKSLKR